MGNGEKEYAKLFPIYEFLVHTLVGSVIFMIIILPAIGLNLGAHYLETINVDKFITYGVYGLEILMFGIDILLFIVFLISSSIEAGKKLWD